MIVRRFRREDLTGFRVQPRQAATFACVEPAVVAFMEAGPAYTLEDGEPLAMAGLATVDDRRIAWAWLAENAPVLALHRYVLAALRAVPKVYAFAAEDWPQAQHWLRMLGFAPTGNRECLAGQWHGEWCRG